MTSDPAEPLDPVLVVGLLAEPARLRAVAALALGARTLGEVAASAGLAVPVVARALDRLVSGGLVEETPGDRRNPAAYRLVEERLQSTARAWAQPKPEPMPGDASVSENQVLANFFREGRLVSIPAAAPKRRLVLDYLAGRFEPGRVYPEREVNFLLGQVHADYAALRRYLVDDGFLERRDGFYWRAGGSFEVD